MPPSHLSHLFMNNVSPNSLEIAAAQRKIDQYTVAINQTQAHLQALKLGRAKYQALLSPLRRKPLPLELLSETFKFLHASIYRRIDDRRYARIEYDPKNNGARQAIIRICLVCKAWRDAAFATPSLWARLDLVWDQVVPDIALRQFQRAGGLPKTLVVVHSPSSSEIQKSRIEDCSLDNLAKLLTEGPTLDHLDLSFHRLDGIRLLERLRSPSATQGSRPWDLLPSLSLEVNQLARSPDPIYIPHAQGVTSFRLALRGLNSWDWDDTQPVPFGIPQAFLGALTSLTLDFNWIGCTILALLRWCTCVETLVINHSEGGGSLHSLRTPFLQSLSQTGVLLPAVQVLQLRYFDPSWTDFLRFLRMPSLVELDMHFTPVVYEDIDELEDATTFETLKTDLLFLVEQSGCEGTLRRLRLDTLYISSDTLASTLVNLPFLTHLTLNGVWFDSTMFNRLRASGATCLPHLEVLELFKLQEPRYVKDAFLFIIATRNLQPDERKLKKIHLSVHTPRHGEQIDPQSDQYLRSLGLDVGTGTDHAYPASTRIYPIRLSMDGIRADLAGFGCHL